MFSPSPKPGQRTARMIPATISKHLKLLIDFVCVIMLLIAVSSIIVGKWLDIVLIIIGLGVTLLARYLFLRRSGAPSIPTLLVVLAMLVNTSLWFNQGLFSGAVLSYPALLIVTGIIASRTLFATFLLILPATVAAVTWASMSGIFLTRSVKSRWPATRNKSSLNEASYAC